jgi:hypothetical protein
VTPGGTTITPENFSTVLAGGDLCVSGTVEASDDASALLGINVAQLAGVGTDVESIVPTSAGITVTVSTVLSPMRVQIQGPGGSWCANITTATDTILWSEFNTACWNNSGTYYNNEALEAVMIQIPGSAGGARTFDYCLTNMMPVGGTTPPDSDTGTPPDSDTGTPPDSDTGTPPDTDTGTGGAYTVATGGYVTSGSMKGYAWTAANLAPAASDTNTTITPANFSTLTAGENLCVSGSVNANYDASSMLAFRCR